MRRPTGGGGIAPPRPSIKCASPTWIPFTVPGGASSDASSAPLPRPVRASAKADAFAEAGG
jgi:hypothetical protein